MAVAQTTLTTGATSGSLSLFNNSGFTGALDFANYPTGAVTAWARSTSISIGSTTTSAQNITIGGSSTGAGTYAFASGPNSAGQTKTVYLGTGGAASSTTNITIGSSSGAGTITLAQQVNLAQQASGVAPLQFTSGTKLSAVTAGAVEFDSANGPVWYGTTNTSHGRGVIPTALYAFGPYTPIAAPTLNTDIQLLGSGYQRLTVAASTLYSFECQMSAVVNTSATSNALQFTLVGSIATTGASGQYGTTAVSSGYATFTSVAYQAVATNANAVTASAASTAYINTSARTAITAAVAAATNRQIYIRGTFRTSAAGIIVPAYSFSAAGTGVTIGDAWFIATPIGAAASPTGVGAWSS